jgi:hypothetical protein
MDDYDDSHDLGDSRGNFSNQYSKLSEHSLENQREPVVQRGPVREVRLKHFSANKSYSDYKKNKNPGQGSGSTRRKRLPAFLTLAMVKEVGVPQESEANLSIKLNSVHDLVQVREREGESSSAEHPSLRKVAERNKPIHTEERRVEELVGSQGPPLSGTPGEKPKFKFLNLMNTVVDLDKINQSIKQLKVEQRITDLGQLKSGQQPNELATDSQIQPLGEGVPLPDKKTEENKLDTAKDTLE